MHAQKQEYTTQRLRGVILGGVMKQDVREYPRVPKGMCDQKKAEFKKLIGKILRK